MSERCPACRIPYAPEERARLLALFQERYPGVAETWTLCDQCRQPTSRLMDHLCAEDALAPEHREEPR